MSDTSVDDFLHIHEKTKEIRKNIIRMNSHAGQGHTGADLSETDMLASLFMRILNIDHDRLDDPDRDRFILSKGHGVGGLYCTLAEVGLLEKSLLDTYLQFDSHLPGHPVRQKTPGVELNTGALGHGLSVGVGLALSAKVFLNVLLCCLSHRLGLFWLGQELCYCIGQRIAVYRWDDQPCHSGSNHLGRS